jgi:hypothetical protein
MRFIFMPRTTIGAVVLMLWFGVLIWTVPRALAMAVSTGLLANIAILILLGTTRVWDHAQAKWPWMSRVGTGIGVAVGMAFWGFFLWVVYLSPRH